jgi:pilus assembly protein CpaE
MGGAVDADAVESLLTTHACGLSVLVAPVQVDSMPVSPDAVGRVLEHLKKTFDFVVVDTSGAFDDYALSAIDHSDVLLLVGTLDIPALKSLKVATDTLDLLNVPRAQWQLVLNRADAKVGLSPSEFEKALDLAINASIPSSLEVPASINRGECIVLANPRHAVSHTINALAASLAAHKSSAKDDAEPRGAHADNSRRGLLRRKVR